jgi:signal transduction histidine kinase
MAVVTDNSAELRSFSIGPVKMQLLTVTYGAADTSATITADRLSSIVAIMVDGVVQTSLPTFSGNVATLAFVAPGGSGSAGHCLVIGK